MAGAMASLTDQCGSPAVEGLGCTTIELADHGVAGLAADEGEGAATVEGTDDGIALKMSHARAVLGAGRSLRDMTFSGEPSRLKPAGDLLGTPELVKTGEHDQPLLLGELPVAART